MTAVRAGADLLEDDCYDLPVAKLVCDCCEREVDYVRGSTWHGKDRICRACFYVWYDHGCTDPAKIKAYVLAAEAAGTWPLGDTRLLVT